MLIFYHVMNIGSICLFEVMHYVNVSILVLILLTRY